MPELHNNTVDPLFDHFVSSVVASVVRGESLPQTYALAERMGPACVLPAIDPDADREQQLILFRTLARAIADQTPRPELGYDTRKQARPGRNDRCDCGSGRKYKQCCGPLEHGAPVERMNLLPHVLKQMPRKRWGELADSAIDPQMVAATAFEMLAADDAVAVVALLEPWFKGEAPIPAARELMLDALLDAFGALARPRKK